MFRSGMMHEVLDGNVYVDVDTDDKGTHPHAVVVADFLVLKVDDSACPVVAKVNRHDEPVQVQHALGCLG